MDDPAGDIKLTENETAKGIGMLYASLILAIFVGSPASGLELSMSTNGVGLSEHLDLDDSTLFRGAIVLSGDNILHDLEAKGSGNNNIKAHVSGDEYAVTNAIISSGDLQTSVSFVASIDSATLRQNHQLAGDAGYMATDTVSRANEMHMMGFFCGAGGEIKANLVSSAGKRSLISGDVEILGVEYLNNEIAQNIADGEFDSIAAEGLFSFEDEEIGECGFAFTNIVSNSSSKQGEIDVAPVSINEDQDHMQDENIQEDIPDQWIPDNIPNWW